MTIRYDRPVSHAAFLARRLGFFALVVLVAVLLAHRFGPLTTPDTLALSGLSVAAAALAVPLAVIGLVRLWQVGAVGGVAAGRALLYSAPTLALTLYGLYLYETRPAIYDVSTDTVDAPNWLKPPSAAQQWFPREPVTPQMREEQVLAYPGLTGRRYEGALDRVYEAVTKVADLNGFDIVQSRGQEFAKPEFQPSKPDAVEGQPENGVFDPRNVPLPLPRPDPALVPVAPVDDQPPEQVGVVRIQAETRTLVLGLRYDILIRLREEAETTLVDIRVAARYGPRDLGIGADIAQHFLAALDAELLGIAGD